jgi:hypothetical protein
MGFQKAGTKGTESARSNHCKSRKNPFADPPFVSDWAPDILGFVA